MVGVNEFVINTAASPQALDSLTASNLNLQTTPQADMTGIMQGYTMASSNVNSGFNTVFSQLGALQGESMENVATLKFLRNMIMANYTALILMNTVKIVRESAAVKEKAAAVIETAMKAAAQQWHSIALATAAAVGVSAAFSIGYYLGKGRSDRDENITIVGDMNDPVERRVGMMRMRTVV